MSKNNDKDGLFKSFKNAGKKKLSGLKRAILAKNLDSLNIKNPLNEWIAEVKNREELSKYKQHYDFQEKFEASIEDNVTSKYVKMNDVIYKMNRSGDRFNFRETCLHMENKLNSRMRFSLEIIDTYFPKVKSVYLAEHETDLHKHLESLQKYQITTSLYQDGHPKHEDLTKLSYADESFDLSMSFEDLEHIPDYKAALKEVFRITKPGGAFLLSVPFIRENLATNVLAKLSDEGEIIHLSEPEYHGDPIRQEGILCFYHFGWDFMDDLRAVGFKDVAAVIGFSANKMILGNQLFIIARK